jgi:hypothetical protein
MDHWKYGKRMLILPHPATTGSKLAGMMNARWLNMLLSVLGEGAEMAAKRSHRCTSIDFSDGHISF